MPLGKVLGFGPGHIVLDVDPVGTQPLPTLGPCLLWPNGPPSHQLLSSCLKRRPSAILDLLCARLDHLRRVFCGVYHCEKFGCNRCSSFDNMQVLIFCELGLKTPIHAPEIWVLP